MSYHIMEVSQKQAGPMVFSSTEKFTGVSPLRRLGKPTEPGNLLQLPSGNLL